MKTIILGIDGLDIEIINYYLDVLPNFRKIKQSGVLSPIKTVFPADSVPAWNTIFTGLLPGEHGIIRGLDYAESYEQYKKNNLFHLQGKTFWDYLSKNGKKCLIVNPFLAYPTWIINGVFESGPAFVKGDNSYYPANLKTKYSNVLGGYDPAKSGEIKENMDTAYTDSEKLWKEFIFQMEKDDFKLSFVTFTTLDRTQHYTWRYFDKNDPLYEEDDSLSDSIKKLLILFDNFLGQCISELINADNLLIISDHGFAQRPYNLINLNELLRQNNLLILNEGSTSNKTIFIQKFRTKIIKILSKLNLLDKFASKLKKIPTINKLKKSDYLINKNESICFADEYFCGKKPYCGINFGLEIKNNLTSEQKIEIKNNILQIFHENNIPKPKWIKLNHELSSGKYFDRYPDICFELPKDYGIEFDLFGKIITKSVTHYKLSGGHLNDGTFGYFSPSGRKIKINHIKDFFKLIIDLNGNS